MVRWVTAVLSAQRDADKAQNGRASNAAIEILKVQMACSPHRIAARWMARRSLLLEGSPSTQPQ